MTSQRIQQMITDVGKLHFDEVVSRAVSIMRQHLNIKTFCMATGVASFYDQDGPMDRKYLGPFYKFLYEHDATLHTTGCPVRIDRIDGKLVRKSDW